MKETNNQFGKNLKVAKATLDISYSNLAKQLEISDSTITYYQNREDNHFIEFLFLLKELGADMNKLFSKKTNGNEQL